MLLGSAIYSKWEYFNHFYNTLDTIKGGDSIQWFILALSRLALLTMDNPFLFNGNLKQINLISNNISYGPIPKVDEEIEQHIILNDEGKGWFVGYNYGTNGYNYPLARKKQLIIDKKIINELFDKFAKYFSTYPITPANKDVGSWRMTLINDENKAFYFTSSFDIELILDDIDLSDYVRNLLLMDDLFVFDGNQKELVINKITLDYKHVENYYIANKKTVSYKYDEHLIINRNNNTLEYIQNVTDSSKVSFKFELDDVISKFLDSFNANKLFTNVKGNPDDVIDSDNDIKDYLITIDFNDNQQRVITGSFDKLGLPDDYEDFAQAIFGFIKFFGFGDILNPNIFNKTKRCESDLILLSVVFDEGHKSYYYLTDDASIETDDLVLVPAGKDNDEKIVRVVDVDYYAKDDLPILYEYTKHIIRKCTDEDFEMLN